MAKKIKTDNDRELAALKEQVKAFCDEAGYQLSPQADSILRDIVHMKEMAGDFYCSCQTQRTAETICVCLPVRNGLVDILGSCFCGLILAKE